MPWYQHRVPNSNFSSSLNPADDATRIITGISASPLLAPGTLLGNTYLIEAFLARGGMGEVYRAKHVEFGTKHAVKIMFPDLAGNAQNARLFREEAGRLGRVR